MTLYGVPRYFSEVQKQIEETLAKLKATKDPFLRREVLKEMRTLLSEAYTISNVEP